MHCSHESGLLGCWAEGAVCTDVPVTETKHALGSPHLRQEGLLIGVLDVLQVGGRDLHFMGLNRRKQVTRLDFCFHLGIYTRGKQATDTVVLE